MPNTLLTDDVIVKNALRLLKNNTVAAPLVYRNYERQYGKVGDTIRLELPYRTKTAEGAVLQTQPLVDQSTNLTINRHRHFGMNYGGKDRRLSLQMFSERYLNSGIVQMANVLDQSVLATSKACFFSGGTPGQTPGSYNVFANACAKQTSFAVPQDRRSAVVNPITMAVLSNEVKDLFNGEMVKGAYTKGYKGMVADYKMYETQNLPNHTTGDWGATSAPEVNGASQTGSSLITDGWDSGASDVKMGDVFTIEGVYGVNPQTYESTGYLQEFVVMEDASDSTGDMTISISPAINDGSLTTTNPNGQTVSLAAYQNVTAAPADNADLTFIGTRDSTYQQNYLFHKEAIALAVIDFEPPEVAKVARTARDPQSGISMLLTGGYDINNFESVYRLDLLWGTKLIYPELALRLWGASAA